MKNLYFVEITDVYGGEANYSWVTRHCVRATTPRGAMRRIGTNSGLSWHCVADYGHALRYDSKSGATCAFVTEWEDEHGDYSRVNYDLQD